jgi:colanic acid/amylovoran biosynthesis protein
MRILITHVFGYANKGDWALLDSLIAVLNEAFTEAQLFGTCRDPISQARYFGEVTWLRQLGASQRRGLPRRLESIWALSLGVLRSYLGKSIAGGPGTIPACFDEMDLIVAAPGGYLEDSNLSIVSTLVHLWLAERSGRPVVLAPQSLGPFRFWFSVIASRAILRKTRLVCVREQFSFDIAQKRLGLGGGHTVFLPDMAFYDNRRNEPAADIILEKHQLVDKSFAAVTAIDWYFPFSTHPEGDKQKYIATMVETIKFIYRELGWKVLILTQVEDSLGVPGDESIGRTISSLAGDCAELVSPGCPPPAMRSLIGRSQVFIGSRMHSNIFALQSGVPVIAIGYLPKTRELMRQLGLGDYVVNIDSSSTDEISKLVVKSQEERIRFKEAQIRMAELGREGRTRLVGLLRDLSRAVRQ